MNIFIFGVFSYFRFLVALKEDSEFECGFKSEESICEYLSLKHKVSHNYLFGLGFKFMFFSMRDFGHIV